MGVSIEYRSWPDWVTLHQDLYDCTTSIRVVHGPLVKFAEVQTHHYDYAALRQYVFRLKAELVHQQKTVDAVTKKLTR
jgi:hypothetical protein